MLIMFQIDTTNQRQFDWALANMEGGSSSINKDEHIVGEELTKDDIVSPMI